MSLTFYRYNPKTGIYPDVVKAFNFPAGEAHVKDARFGREYGDVFIADMRGCDAAELFQLAVWAEAHDNVNSPTVILMPYLPAARADKALPGEAVDARVYARFLNSMNSVIITLDPHSEVMPSMVHNLIVVDPVQMLAYGGNTTGTVGVIAPDAGAVKRAGAAARALGIPLIQATKVRDQATGKLSTFECPDLPPGHYLVVDDICDGGGTFVGLADAIFDKHDAAVSLDLWVTHGIFSKGLDELLNDRYDTIYTTDSYPSGPAQWPALGNDHLLRVIPALPALIGAIDLDKL